MHAHYFSRKSLVVNVHESVFLCFVQKQQKTIRLLSNTNLPPWYGEKVFLTLDIVVLRSQCLFWRPLKHILTWWWKSRLSNTLQLCSHVLTYLCKFVGSFQSPPVFLTFHFFFSILFSHHLFFPFSTGRYYKMCNPHYNVYKFNVVATESVSGRHDKSNDFPDSVRAFRIQLCHGYNLRTRILTT